jgi:hypothetical protein
MRSPDAYLAEVSERLLEDGCEVTEETVGSFPSMVGYRNDIRALSKLHLFIVVATLPMVRQAAVRAFSQQVSEYAEARKGASLGMQSGIVALAALVAPSVDEAAKSVAARPFRLGRGGYATVVQPVVVDLAEGRVHTFRGRRLWGAAFAGYLRDKSGRYLPDPS